MKKIFAFLASIGLFITSMVRAESCKPLVIVLMGPPGAGKGTHAVELSKKLNIPHISTGDLFRENLKNNTPLGKKANAFIEKGQLVPDELVIDMLFDRISKSDCSKGYILDGFPRTIKQAQELDSKLNKKVKLVAVNLDINDQPLVERITGRIVCKSCGTPFHKKYLPPQKSNICDNCQGELSQRKDDTEEVVKERLKIYHEQSQPVIDFYTAKNNVLYQVNADTSKENVFKNLVETLDHIK